jgi:nitrogenase-stabilizing/protective protein
MTLEDDLRSIEVAEDLFELLGLTFEKRVLVIHRLHVLKRFGEVFESIATKSAHRPEAERRELYREALRAAHDEFASPALTRPSVFAGVRRGLVELGSGGLLRKAAPQASVPSTPAAEGHARKPT